MASLTQRDVDVVKGSRDPLNNVEASLRDQIPKKLEKKLRDQKIGQVVSEAWDRGNANRAEWLERQKDYERDLDENRHEARDVPLKGSSNLHVPLSLSVIKVVHARFVQALLADLTPQTKARRSDSLDRAELVRNTMGYYLKEGANHNEGVEHEIDKMILNWCALGEGIWKWRWDKQFEKFIDVEKVIQPGDPEEIEGPDGQIISSPTFVESEQEVERIRERCNCPVLENKANEDFLTIGHWDPQLADMVLDDYMVTANDMWQWVDQSVFNEKAVRAVIKSGPDQRTGRQSTDVKQERADRAGKASPVDGNIELERYRIIEGYLSWDVDGNGINSEIVVWIHPRTRELLRATYLRRINKAGERPYFKSKFMLRPGGDDNLPGLGLLEILHPLSIELDFHHNARIDFGLLSTLPYGFYRASSSMDPNDIELEPGMLYAMEDPQNDIFFPNLGNRTAFGLQEENQINSMVQRVTGISDINMGVVTGAQGPTRTAAGVRGLLSESNSNLDIHLRRINRTWKQALRYLLHMLQQRIPDGLEFKITGEDGQDYFQYIKDREDIRGDFDFELNPTSATSNPMIQQDRANLVFQLQQNPLLIQSGIITQGNLFEGARNVMIANGIKDHARFITKPPQYQPVFTPEEEANRILRGIQVPIQLNADHQGFIDYVNFIMTESTPEGAKLLGQYSEQEIQVLAEQSAQHEQALAAIQQAEAQASNLLQQQTNATASAQLPIQLPSATEESR